LDDTIQPFEPQTGVGNGFKFAETTADALLRTVTQALALYRQREQWLRLMKNAMLCDFSWTRSAEEYEALYDEIASRRIPRGA
jgi:starch synthase